MQQQISQQEQYGNQHQQIAQPMMICPIQYVYETPMLVPQHQEEQIQRNQVLFNVQNTPPWIQNRPQNQVVYVQQVPNNYQQFIHPHMMQNSIYHPQLNYQIQQPMMTQDGRQFVQIPNIANFNTVQSQPAQIIAQQINTEEPPDKMPLLTQMLQKTNANNNVRAQNNTLRPTTPNTHIIKQSTPTANMIRPSTPTANMIRSSTPTANMMIPPTATANVIRPETQNQQVQTDISANNKGRPKNAQPQIITINPMQQRQFIATNQKPADVLVNIARPAAPYMRAEVPQHIRSKIPSSISVKTIYRPILPRPLIRPFDGMPAQQNFFYTHNFVTTPNPEIRNNMMNKDNSHMKQNNNTQTERNTKPAEVHNNTVRKLSSDSIGNASPKCNMVKTYEVNNVKKATETSIRKSTESQTQTEEKLIRNTVYIQARGRVLNEKEIQQSKSPKRTIDDRLEEERVSNNTNLNKEPTCSSGINKYAKVEVTESGSQTYNISVNYPAIVPTNYNTQQCKTSKCNKANTLPVNTDDVKLPDLNTAEPNEMINVPTNLNSQKPEIKKESDLEVPKNSEKTNVEQKIASNINNTSTDKEERHVDVKEVVIKVPSAGNNNNSAIKEETNFKYPKRNYEHEGIKVLTHVLDGYIIQESNVAFPIYKPIEKENIQATPKQQQEEEHFKKDGNTDGRNEATDTEKTPTVPWRYWNTNAEPQTEKEPVDINKDDPFANIKKSTVQSWTIEQLTTHLAKYGWNETAAKLQDEEIDGESLLLVNREQLVTIGVCERHADEISAFTSAS